MNKIPTTFAVFKVATGLNGDPEHRGSQIRYVDDVFKEYDKDFSSADDGNKQFLTSKLYLACKKWLYDKRTKELVTETLLGKLVHHLNVQRRRDEISKVALECLEELLGKTEPRGKFEARKIKMLRQGREGPRAVPLSGTYMYERETWDERKSGGFSGDVGEAVSASLVHQHLQGKKKDEKFGRLSRREFDRYAAESEKQINKKHVPYYRKKKRLGYLVDIKAGLLCSTSSGKPIDCQLPAFDLKRFKRDNWQNSWKGFKQQLHLYAMDRYGNLFENRELGISDLSQDYGRSFGSYNHSTFNAGRDVICAGFIGVNRGRLMWIDYESGHYRPGPDNLKKALRILLGDGADLSQTVVPLRDFTTGENHFFEADKFLYNGKPFGTA